MTKPAEGGTKQTPSVGAQVVAEGLRVVPLGVWQDHLVQQVVQVLFGCIFKFDGMVRQFITDDKGTVLIGCFGLPPYTEDHEFRAVMCGLEMLTSMEKLKKYVF